MQTSRIRFARVRRRMTGWERDSVLVQRSPAAIRGIPSGSNNLLAAGTRSPVITLLPAERCGHGPSDELPASGVVRTRRSSRSLAMGLPTVRV